MKCLRSGFLILLFLKVEAQASPVSIADSLYAVGNNTRAINEYAKSTPAIAALQKARCNRAIGNFEKAIAQYRIVKEQTPIL